MLLGTSPHTPLVSRMGWAPPGKQQLGSAGRGVSPVPHCNGSGVGPPKTQTFLPLVPSMELAQKATESGESWVQPRKQSSFVVPTTQGRTGKADLVQHSHIPRPPGAAVRGTPRDPQENRCPRAPTRPDSVALPSMRARGASRLSLGSTGTSGRAPSARASSRGPSTSTRTRTSRQQWLMSRRWTLTLVLIFIRHFTMVHSSGWPGPRHRAPTGTATVLGQPFTRRYG